jgi:serine protease Do
MKLPVSCSFRAAALACSALAGVTLAAVPLPGTPLLPAAFAKPAPDSFADLAEKLLPAVVNISSTTQVKTAMGPEMPMFPPGSPFEQFFKDFMNRHRPGGGNGQTPPPEERKMQSLGSGFIIDPSGLVVTNNHVIDGADEITVTLQDNTSLKATVVGRDSAGDIALLKVKSDKPLPALEFGDSSAIRIGDWVLAIGNPFGLGGSVTAGIVSARGRDIHEGPYDDFIQTDAPINRGNSGGPLFNMDGKVIGINTAIYSPSGGSIGIGFAIPANMARMDVDQLRQYGHPRRGWLGVRIQEVTPDIAESLGLHPVGGAMVAGVNPEGPADKAHLRNGDVIVQFNGQDVKDMRALPRIVADSEVGKQVPIVVWRDGKQVTLQATLAEMPEDRTQLAAATSGKPSAPEPMDMSALGMKLAPLTKEMQDKYQLSDHQKGVVVTEVAPDGAAAKQGLKPGDVIVEVQQSEVNSPADVQQYVDSVRKENRKSVLMLIQRQDGMQWIPVPLGTEEGQKG